MATNQDIFLRPLSARHTKPHPLLHPITTHEIAWLAGLLEGEGSFGHKTARKNGTPYITARVSLEMCDIDIVTRARKILDAPAVYARPARKAHGNDTYRIDISGSKAIAVMMTILPFMGERRRTRILACIDAWKGSSHRPHSSATHCLHGHAYT